MSIANDDNLSLIFSRRSIRVYAPGEVTDPSIRRMLDAAMAAPSAMTKDPWRFVVVREKEMLRRLPAVLPGGGMLATASAAIVACGDLDAAFEQNISYLLQDCSAAIENLLLAAQALGVGACWVGVHPAEESMRQLRALFGLPARIVPVAVISLGLPGEQPESRTRFNAEYVRYGKW